MDSLGFGFDSMCGHDLRSGAPQDCIGENASFCLGVAVLGRYAYKLVVSGVWVVFPFWFPFVDVHYQEISFKCGISDGKSRFYLCVDCCSDGPS